jgi:hypothetical protein
MGGSIRVCVLEKNRWWGKALLSRSHESCRRWGAPGSIFFFKKKKKKVKKKIKNKLTKKNFIKKIFFF